MPRSESRQPWIFCAASPGLPRRLRLDRGALTIGCAAADFRPAHGTSSVKTPLNPGNFDPHGVASGLLNRCVNNFMRPLTIFAASGRTVNPLRVLVRDAIRLDHSWAHVHVPHFQEIPR